MKKQPVPAKMQFGKNASSKRWLYIVAPLAATATATALHAEGMRDATTGAFDLGRSGGRIAHVDDATAIQNNPANLMDVTNVDVELDPSVIYYNVNYKSPDGTQSASTIHPVKVLPSFFASMPLFDDRIVAGLGVTIPFGLANQWDSTSSAFSPTAGGRLSTATPNFGKLTTYNINPSVAFKIIDSVQVGVGLDAMWSQLEFRQYIVPGSMIVAHAAGTGNAVGGNLGVTWSITEHQRLAFTYRSTMTMNYSGTLDLENTGAGSNPSTSFNSQIKFPNILSAGYGIDLPHNVRLESDVEWLQWSQFKNLGIQTGTIPGIGNLSQTVPEDWHNTFTAGIGGDWSFADHWVVRAGYQYFESPVPDYTFSPTIPDANQNVITMGIGWHGKNLSAEFAYGLDFYNDRNITSNQNAALEGKYTFNVHLFSLAIRYAF